MNNMHSLFSRLSQSPILRCAAVMLVALAWSSPAICAKNTPREALLKAARKGNAQKAASLVHSVDPSWVALALIEAARLGHLNVVQAMVANGADINGNEGGGKQPIRKPEQPVQSSGSFDFHPLTMLDLIRVDCLTGLVESPRSPLIAAARAGKLEVVKWLVEQKADLDLQGGARIFKDLQQVGGTGTFRPVCEENIGNNALSEAILAGQVSIVQILVERGADLSRRVVFRSAATDPAIVGFYGVGVLLQDSSGLVHEAVEYGKHIWVSNDGLIKTDLKIQLQQELTIRELASYSTRPEIKALAGVQTSGAKVDSVPKARSEYVIAELKPHCPGGVLASNADIMIEAVGPGSSYVMTSGRLEYLPNGQSLAWCSGARHTIKGRLETGGYTFISDLTDPLVFRLSDRGYVYERGKGTVITPSNENVLLQLTDQSLLAKTALEASDASIRSAAAAKLEDEDWNAAVTPFSSAKVEAFLQRHPNGSRAIMASEIIKDEQTIGQIVASGPGFRFVLPTDSVPPFISKSVGVNTDRGRTIIDAVHQSAQPVFGRLMLGSINATGITNPVQVTMTYNPLLPCGDLSVFVISGTADNIQGDTADPIRILYSKQYGVIHIGGKGKIFSMHNEAVGDIIFQTSP